MPEFLTKCLNEVCGADTSFLKRVQVLPFHGAGNVENNPVIVCVSCGTIMVRVGIIGEKRGWTINPPINVEWD